MKEFNWTVAKERRSPRKYEWLEENHSKKISEDDYVAQNVLLKHFRTSKGKWNYNPSHLRAEYRNLRDKFGFFA